MLLWPFVVVFVFYIIIPIVSALISFYNWKRFKRNFVASIKKGYYGNLKDGDFISCFGRLESIVRNDILWIKIDNDIVWVDTQIAPVYLLENMEDRLLSCKNNIKRLSPLDLEGLFTGLNVYLAGKLTIKDGNYYLKKGERSFCILFSGSDKGFFPYVIAKSGVQNDLWNPVTLLSIGIAMCLLIIYGFMVIQSKFAYAIISLSLAGLPVSVFFPPAIVFYYFFRKLWVRGKKHLIASELSLYKSTMLGCSPSPYGKRLIRKGWGFLSVSLLTLGLGMFLQLYIIIILMVLFFNSV